MNVAALMDTFGSFRELCFSILRSQGFENIPDEEIDSFFDALEEEELTEVYTSISNMNIELVEIQKQLEEYMSAKNV